MGKVFRIHLRVEPFAVLFWALGIVLAHIQFIHIIVIGDPARRLASLNYGSGTVLYTAVES